MTCIKKLYIEIYDLSRDQFCHWIPALFPNIEQLTIKSDDEQGKLLQLKECALQEFRFLKKINFR